jgi:hypothetical protein
MAKKQSASILNKLRGLIQATPEKPEASKEGGKRSERRPSTSSPDAAAADASGDKGSEQDKKRTSKQPWYRHRQRW